jgi:hypothetical protein
VINSSQIPLSDNTAITRDNLLCSRQSLVSLSEQTVSLLFLCLSVITIHLFNFHWSLCHNSSLYFPWSLCHNNSSLYFSFVSLSGLLVSLLFLSLSVRALRHVSCLVGLTVQRVAPITFVLGTTVGKYVTNFSPRYRRQNWPSLSRQAVRHCTHLVGLTFGIVCRHTSVFGLSLSEYFCPFFIFPFSLSKLFLTFEQRVHYTAWRFVTAFINRLTGLHRMWNNTHLSTAVGILGFKLGFCLFRQL